MNDVIQETQLEATRRLDTTRRPAETRRRDATSPATVAPTRRTLPPGALRSDHTGTPVGRRVRTAPVAGGVVAAVVLVALGVVFLRPPAAPEPVAVLEIVRGSVVVFPQRGTNEGQDPSRLFTLEAGAPILAGTVIETRGAPTPEPVALTSTVPARAVLGKSVENAPGRAALRLADGSSVRLDTGTRVRVASSSALVLERGAVYVDSGLGESAVEVRTTLGVVRDIGTQFEVRLLSESTGDELRVRVREGRVTLQRDGQSYEADAGVELAMDRDGNLTRGASAIWGPHWSWVLETAPPPETRDQPLQVFLDWFVREGGWKLRFADDETAEIVETIILRGGVDGLTPVEAADTVFQGSGLAYRLDNDTLWVEPIE